MDKKIKVLVVGASQIGKSHLIDTLAENYRLYRYMPTNGINCTSLYHEGRTLKFYDAGGTKCIAPIVNRYLSAADVIVLAFSYNNLDSLSALDALYLQAKDKNPYAHFVLLGLQAKTTMSNVKRIDYQIIRSFITRHAITLFCDCDSKDNYGLEAFKNLLVYYSKLEDKLNDYANISGIDPLFWCEQKSVIENMKTLFLEPFKKDPFSFFSCQKRQDKKALITILSHYMTLDNSLTHAKLMLLDIELYSSTHLNVFDNQIDFVKSKLELLQLQRIINSNGEIAPRVCLYP